jgi:hypothetical protein
MVLTSSASHKFVMFLPPVYSPPIIKIKKSKGGGAEWSNLNSGEEEKLSLNNYFTVQSQLMMVTTLQHSVYINKRYKQFYQL